MAEVKPITQPVQSDQDAEDPETIEKERRKRKKTCWQRFCASFSQCCENFWCCRNECYDICCNYSDVDDDDEREVAFSVDKAVDDRAAFTVIIEDVVENGNVGHSESKLHGGSHHGADHEGHRGGDHSGVNHDVEGNHSGGGHSERDDCGGGDSGGGDCGGGDD